MHHHLTSTYKKNKDFNEINEILLINFPINVDLTHIYPKSNCKILFSIKKTVRKPTGSIVHHVSVNKLRFNKYKALGVINTVGGNN